MIRTIGKITLQCDCMRPECGLGKTPIRIDETDAAKMWLPVGYSNFIEGTTFPTTEKKDIRFKDRLEAARKYIEDMGG